MRCHRECVATCYIKDQTKVVYRSLRQIHYSETAIWPYNGEIKMKTWTTPKFLEVTLGLEINCYACADL